MHQYLFFIWNADDAECRSAMGIIHSTISSTPGWVISQKEPGILLAHTTTGEAGPRAHILPNRRGLILGTLFPRDDSNSSLNRVTHVDATESEKIVSSHGQRLIDKYWGSYVALIHQRETGASSVLRDPTANTPCFYATWRKIHIFFSHVSACLQAVPCTFTPNWRHLAAQLIISDEFLTRDCALREVEDIPGGECVQVTRDRVERHVLWSPSQFCEDVATESAEIAGEKLRSTVQNVVNAWASCHKKIVHELSGGLDSSIVAGCLARAPSQPNVTCVNFFIGGASPDEPLVVPGLSAEDLAKVRRIAGHADEREFARLVAERCKFTLIERERRAAGIDLRGLSNAPMSVRPSKYVQILDMDTAITDVVQAEGASAIFSGLGGDTVFYTTLRPLGAIDYAYQHPFGSRLLTEILASTKLSRESILRVAGKVIAHGYMNRPLPPVVDILHIPHLMKDDIVSGMDARYLNHPWRLHSRKLMPGKREHLKGITSSALFYNYVFNVERYASSVNPLVSQPIVELSLRIPSYVLLAGGVSRGLARSSFAPVLPQRIVRRTLKGLSFSFWQHLLRTNMDYVREILLDGLLVREGLLDRQKLESYLVADQPFLTVLPGQVMCYLACEAWMRQWHGLQQRAAA